MNVRTKIYVGIAITAIFALGLAGGSVSSNRKIANLEHDVETARHAADIADKLAVTREIEAAEYKQKIEYLESRLAEIQTIARKQDEELETLNTNSGRARGDVERARRTRSAGATADELCAKLAEIGHGCER